MLRKMGGRRKSGGRRAGNSWGPYKIETSEELKEFLESEIEGNEQADLNHCLDAA